MYCVTSRGEPLTIESPLEIILSEGTRDGGRSTNKESYDRDKKVWTIQIGDSAQAWAKSSRCYVDFLRFGPPNTRLISRTESEDFLNWSPKVTVIRRTRMDEVQQTQFYQMAPLPLSEVRPETVQGDVKLLAVFSEFTKPLILNKTNIKRLASEFGTTNTAAWRGRVTIYVDETVEYAGEITGGIRLRGAAKNGAQQPALQQINEGGELY